MTKTDSLPNFKPTKDGTNEWQVLLPDGRQFFVSYVPAGEKVITLEAPKQKGRPKKDAPEPEPETKTIKTSAHYQILYCMSREEYNQNAYPQSNGIIYCISIEGKPKDVKDYIKRQLEYYSKNSSDDNK